MSTFDELKASLKSNKKTTQGADITSAPATISEAIQPEASSTYEQLKSGLKSHFQKYGYGNIDLTKRPIVPNGNGYSTVRSIGIEEDGVQVVIPTVSQEGKLMTNKEAVDYYHKTGEYLGKFMTQKEADEYAQQIHEQQAAYYNTAADKLQTSIHNVSPLPNTPTDRTSDYGLQLALEAAGKKNWATELSNPMMQVTPMTVPSTAATGPTIDQSSKMKSQMAELDKGIENAYNLYQAQQSGKLKSGANYKDIYTRLSEQKGYAQKAYDTLMTSDQYISEKMPEWIALASGSGKLTDAEKAEAETAARVIGQSADRLYWSHGNPEMLTHEEQQQYNTLIGLSEALNSKTSAVQAAILGAANIIPGEKIGKGLRENIPAFAQFQDNLYSNKDVASLVSGSNFSETAQAAHPLAYGAGNFVANTAAVIGLGAGVSAVTKLIPGFAKLAPVIKSAIDGAITMGTFSGASSASQQTWSKEEWDAREAQMAKQDPNYKPQEYSAWKNTGNVLWDTINGGLMGLLGGAASAAVGEGVLSALKSSTLSGAAIKMITGTSSGLAFGVTFAGVNMNKRATEAAAAGKAYKPDGKEILSDVLFGTAFGLVSSIGGETPANGEAYGKGNAAKLAKAQGFEYFKGDTLLNEKALSAKMREYTNEYADVLKGGGTDAQKAQFNKISEEYNAAKNIFRAENAAVVKNEILKTWQSGKTMELDSPVMKDAVDFINSAAEEAWPAGPELPGNSWQQKMKDELAGLMTETPAETPGTQQQGGLTLPGGETMGTAGIRADMESAPTEMTGNALTLPGISAAEAPPQSDALTAPMASSQGEAFGGSLETGDTGNRLTLPGIKRPEYTYKPELQLGPNQHPFILADGTATNPRISHLEVAQAAVGGGRTSKELYKFMSLGNVRLSGESDSINVEMVTKPTGSQLETILTYAGDRPITYDFTGENGKIIKSGKAENFKGFRRIVNEYFYIPAKGGKLNVTGGQQADVLYDGGGQRDVGAGAGGQTGGLVESTGRDSAERIPAGSGIVGKNSAGTAQRPQGLKTQNMTARERRDAVNEANVERVSPASLGVADGSEETILAVVPKTLHDEEMQKAAQKAKQNGYDVTYFTGGMLLNNGKQANAVKIGYKIYAQADNNRYTVKQLVDHEMFHGFAAENPGLVAEIKDTIAAQHSEDELNKIAGEYQSGYKGAGDAYGEDIEPYIEEILADAYAGINRFGTKATAYSEDVHSTVNKRSGAVSEMQDANRTRGPPEDSAHFSLQELPDGTKFAEVDTDQKIFDGVKVSDYPKIARRLIVDKYRDKIIGESGNKAFVNAKSADEYAYSAARRLPAETKAAKMRAAAELDTLMKASTFWKNEPDDGRHPKATGGWDKYKTLFRVKDQFYEGIISVEVTEQGRLFYDMTKIRNITEVMSGQSGSPQKATSDGNVPKTNLAPGEKKSNSKFSLEEPFEESGDLVAVHNLSEENLRGALELGGFPMPSIAIIKAGAEHSRYGSISIVFGKETINPADRRNKVYGRDAWTPSFPSVSYKLNTKEVDAISERVRGLFKGTDYGHTFNLALDEDNMQDVADRNGGNLYSYFHDKPAMQLAYLKEKGSDFAPVIREKKLSNYAENSLLQYLSDKMGGKIDAADGYQEVNALDDQVRTLLNDWYKAKGVDLKFDKSLGFSKMDSIVSGVKTLRERGVTYETDPYATQDNLKAYFEQHDDAAQGYNEWLKKMLGSVIVKRGIRNNTDFFTYSGNRRSWDALHSDYTLDNIVKAMQGETEKGVGFISGPGTIAAAASKNYKSIDEIRADKKRLMSMEPEKYEEIKKQYEDRLTTIVSSMMEGYKGHNQFEGIGNAAEAITEAVRKSRTVEGIYQQLKGWTEYNVTIETAEDVLELAKDMAQMPTEYFEAKPRRAVPLNEIVGAVIPDNLPAELRDGLDANRVNYIEYKAGDEQSRIEAVNKVPEARFSMEDEERDYAPVFYSRMERAIDTFKGDKLGASSLESYLLGRGVDADEIKWSGIRQFLAGKKSVSKTELLEFVRGNELRIEETTLGGKIDPSLSDQEVSDTFNFPKYEEYKLGGGTNYREILFRLPNAKETPHQPHWTDKNQRDVVAHTRLQDFKAADGGSVLFVDEIQSDWHQQGREKGYKNKEFDKLISDFYTYHNEINEYFSSRVKLDWHTDYEINKAKGELATKDPEFRKMTEKSDAMQEEIYAKNPYPGNAYFGNDLAAPDAPFREDWQEFVLKRVIRMAAEGDYDYVAWTTGQMQADRYDLSKDITYIEARKTSDEDKYYLDTGTDRGMQIPQASGYKTEKEIIELFGKDLGRRIINGANANGKILITDDGLSIGGEGMKNFYDIGGKSSQNIPRYLSRYVKPWGSKVQKIDIVTGQETQLDPEREHRLTFAWDGETVNTEEDETQDTYETVPAIDVTPEMKKSVLYEGQARFSLEEDSDGKKLTTEQADFFKDSKVRDEDMGNVVAFSPGQIKSVDNKNPTGNPDIRYSLEARKMTLQQRMDKARKEFANNLLDAFHVKDNRKELGDTIDGLTAGLVFVDNISEKRLKEVFDALYNAGIIKQVIDPYADAVRKWLKASRIYVPERVKKEFGDDWNSIQKKAFGNGIYFVNDPLAREFDSKYSELAAEFGGTFEKNETDESEMIRNIMDLIEHGGVKELSLPDAAYQEGGSEAVDAQIEYLDAMLRQELQKMGEKWRIETSFKPKSDIRKMPAKARIDYLRKLYGLDAPTEDFKLKLRGSGEVPEDMTVEEYITKLDEQAKQQRVNSLRLIDKENFKGTPAMEKLGIKIDGGVADYSLSDALLRRDRGAKSVKKALKEAEKRLNATSGEKNIANEIVSGVLTEYDIPQTMNADTVMELADYYAAEAALGQDMLIEQRRNIARIQQEAAAALFGQMDKFKQSSVLLMNNRTPERNMLHMFGDELGAKINARYFDRVGRNSAEKIRWVNSQLDQVRKFTDKNGKRRKLTKEEDALVQQVMEGTAAAKTVAGMQMGTRIKDAAENLLNGGTKEDQANEFNLHGKDLDLAVDYSKWLQTQKTIAEGNYDNVIIQNAANKGREMYDSYYPAINDFRRVHGYEDIGWIKGYAPHLQSEENSNIFINTLKEMFGLKANDTFMLPTEIAGLTADYRPNSKWNRHFMPRTGDKAEDGFYAGLESYVLGLGDVLYHTDDIMRIRAAVNYMRSAYAPKEIKANIDWMKGLREASKEVKLEALREAEVYKRDARPSAGEINEAMEAYIEEQFNKVAETSTYNELVKYLENYANKLAGKQLMQDRGTESGAGRKALNLAGKLQRGFARAQVAANISSALNQSSQLPMIIAENGIINTKQALWDIASGELWREGWWHVSDFLTGKRGIEHLIDSPMDMIANNLFKPLELMDRMISTLAVRGRYIKEIKRGVDPSRAMRLADEFGRKVMGSRLQGERPLGFEAKNPLSAMAHIFQLEVMNSLEHETQDVFGTDFRKTAREKGKAAAARELVGKLLMTLLVTFIINRFAEKIYGGTPALYDIPGFIVGFLASGYGLTINDYLKTVIDNAWEKIAGERLFGTKAIPEGLQFNLPKAAADTGYNILNDIPFVRNVAGILGLGDQTLPTIDFKKMWVDVQNMTLALPKGDGWTMADNALDFIGKLIPGGRQIDKIYQGVSTMIRGGYVKGTADKEQVQYVVNEKWYEWIQASLFGKSGLEQNSKYYASGEKALSVKQTDLWQKLVAAGADSSEVWQTILDIRHAGDIPNEQRGIDQNGDYLSDPYYQRAALAASALTDQQKAAIYYDMAPAEEQAYMDKLRLFTNADMGEVYKVLAAMKDIVAVRDKDRGVDAKGNPLSDEYYSRAVLAGSSLADSEKAMLYYDKMASVPEQALMDKLNGAGANLGEAYKLLTAYKDISTIPDENRAVDNNGDPLTDAYYERLTIAESNLTGAEKEMVYYDKIASDKEQKLMDSMIGKGTDPGELYKTLSAFKDVGAIPDAERIVDPDGVPLGDAYYERAVLAEANLTDAEKELVYYDGMTSEKERAFMDTMIGKGTDSGELYKTLAAMKDAEAELNGSEASNAQRDAIAEAGITEAQKMDIYTEKISKSRADDIAAIMGTGITFNKYLDLQNHYNSIYEEYADQGAPRQAIEFAAYLDGAGLKPEQVKAVEDSLVYYSPSPQEAGNYHKLAGAGMDTRDAYDLSVAIDNLDPIEGKPSVSDIQKYDTVAKSGLSDDLQMTAMRGLMQEGEYKKLQAAYGYNVTPAAYVAAKQNLVAIASGTSIDQKEATQAVKMIPGLTSAQRAALWAILGPRGKSAWTSNPFNSGVGATMRALLKKIVVADDTANTGHALTLPGFGEVTVPAATTPAGGGGKNLTLPGF